MVRRVGVFLVVLTAVWWTVGCAIQRRVLFPRGFAQPAPQTKEEVRNLEQLWLDTPAGKVEAWLMLGDDVSAATPGPAVIFAHGNAELIDHNAIELQEYQRLGVTVLLVEYRGYGRSAGSPSQAGIVADFVQAYDLLAARDEVDASRIVLHGRSVGGGVVLDLATKRKAAAVITQSTFTSVTAMAGRYLMPPFLIRDPFDNAAAVRQLDCPILIMHGEHDSIIPFSHGKKLASLAKDATLIAYACDHNNLPPDEQQYWKDVKAFLVEAGVLDDE